MGSYQFKFTGEWKVTKGFWEGVDIPKILDDVARETKLKTIDAFAQKKEFKGFYIDSIDVKHTKTDDRVLWKDVYGETVMLFTVETFEGSPIAPWVIAVVIAVIAVAVAAAAFYINHTVTYIGEKAPVVLWGAGAILLALALLLGVKAFKEVRKK